MKNQGHLYLRLIAGVGAILLVVGGVGWYAARWDMPWQETFVTAVFGFVAMSAFAAFAGLIAIVYVLKRSNRYSQLVYRVASGALHWLYQPAVFLGRAFGVEKDRIRGSFIDLHNRLASQLPVRVDPEKILILAPVCLQLADCRHKVTVDVNNCARCGRCGVDGLLSLKDTYNVHVAVATGGTFARKLLKDLKPRAVVAIACERDLVSGLQDTRPLLVLGVTNERPNGPCFNTQVSLTAVEKAIRHLVMGEQYADSRVVSMAAVLVDDDHPVRP